MKAVYDKFIALLWRGMSLPADDACLTEPMDEQEWATVYLLSMRQAVVGIVWSGVETLSPSCRPPAPMAEYWAEAVKVIGNDYDRIARVVEHHRRGLEYEGPIGELLLRCEHALHHAMVTGMGFRHLCDYLMALKYYEGQYDADEYHKVLQDRGLLKWEKAMTGLDPRLVRLMFKDGNMGFGRRRRFLGGFSARAALFMQLCPGLFMKRWTGLAVGHLRKNS